MDLGAYAQIGSIVQIMNANGIDEIPRLRGLRLMRDEKPLTPEEYAEIINNATIDAYKHIIEAEPIFTINPRWYSFSVLTKQKYKKYLLYKDGNIVGFRWDRVHGKHRKAVKYEVKLAVRETKRQWDMWNKFAGRDDVLYIHARLGRTNWSGICGESFSSKPWFLGCANDAWDTSYCDIYAKIDPELSKESET